MIGNFDFEGEKCKLMHHRSNLYTVKFLKKRVKLGLVFLCETYVIWMV
jgi:hypothetical protein